MEELVVDSKYGRRALTEVAPMYPSMHNNQLMWDSIEGQYRPHTEGNFPSHSRQNFSHAKQSLWPMYPEPVPYTYGHGFGLVPNGHAFCSQPGEYVAPKFLHNSVPVYTDPWRNSIQPGPGMYHRNSATSHGYPIGSDSLQPPYYSHQGNLFNHPSNHLPVYEHPNQLRPMYEQQPNIGIGASGPARNPNPCLDSRTFNSKPKSAHYFYGPDGGLLSGPGEFYKDLDPPPNRVSQSEPVLNHYPENSAQVNENKSSGDFLVEVVLRYGKLKSVTVKNSSPNFKTLPEFLVDELEKHYCRIPETHVVLVAVNGSYSIYASPCTGLDSRTPITGVQPERERPSPYIKHNTTQ